MNNTPKANKWTVLIGAAVLALTVKTFLPDVWTRAGEEIQPVIDGVQRVVDPAFNGQDDDSESSLASHPDHPTNPEDEEFHFWDPVGKP